MAVIATSIYCIVDRIPLAEAASAGRRQLPRRPVVDDGTTPAAMGRGPSQAPRSRTVTVTHTALGSWVSGEFTGYYIREAQPADPPKCLPRTSGKTGSIVCSFLTVFSASDATEKMVSI